MGHRNSFRASQMFEMDHDQNQNHLPVEQPYLHIGEANTFQASSIVPMDNVSTRGPNAALPWNSASRSIEYSSPSMGGDLPQHRVGTSSPFHGPFLHSSADGSFSSAPQNYADHQSSSYNNGHMFHEVEGSSIENSTLANARGQCKRKSPVTADVRCQGSTSSYSSAGSSFGFSVSPNLHPEKLNTGSQQWPWDPMSITTPGYRETSLSISEPSQRNVRSRSTLDLEMNLARTHLSNNSYYHPHSAGHSVNFSGTMELAGPSFTATGREWNSTTVSPTARGRILSSESADRSGSSQWTDQLAVGSSSATAPVQLGGHHHDLVATGSSVPHQNLHGPADHAVRGSRSGYVQRPVPAYRAISNFARGGGYRTSHANGLHLEPYPSRHSTLGWRGNDRIGRSRILYERSRSLSDDVDAHDRMVSEGLMMVDHSALYGARNLLDRHRDMRLDVDNMSYEELLALGERIGNVSTGLSQSSIAKCLVETHYLSNEKQEEGNCVICLEDYKNREEVGKLLNCGHDFHVGCIKKWLPMKNSCPICKGVALADDLKEK
ncbi:hypothetical protein IFM89_000497 [Coptis chinensis]|uniref:RING-type E3 ubiquitin transferase n=1 Tax=Coptis chinensis TaxID=261450 RepID=A0A835H3G2_9MAGN|nr:hypothetical protein IFM89_000497 [Coptis chinensis]